MPQKQSPHQPAAAQGDDLIIEIIFDNSALPVGRKIERTDTMADLGYEFLDFVELCVDLEARYAVDLEEMSDPDKFGSVKVEEVVQAVKRRAAAPVPAAFDTEGTSAINV